ncbi:uncharacterized protein LOC134714621 isoform X1 [Mytilus trossulus]|uniref:uncharacterized protein LOC134714621 isoform X1 n=1 Tax=Mytilus trossulus TaxID=6551 RepID=UPI00300402DA
MSVSSKDYQPALPVTTTTSTDHQPALPVTATTSTDYQPALPVTGTTSTDYQPALPVTATTSTDYQPALPVTATTSTDYQPVLPVTATTSTDSILDNSISNMSNIHPLSNGCLMNGFLETEEIVNLLTSFVYPDALDNIPEGIKNNVYFIVKNDDNVERQKQGDQSEFPDDCGVYNSNRGKDPKTYFIVNPEGTLQMLYKRGDQFYSALRIKGNLIYLPLQTQPSLDILIELNRNYLTLSNDSSYLRRVSWLGGHDNHIAVVEYVKSYTESIQTSANITDEITDIIQDKLLNVKRKLEHDESSGPSCKKQAHNKKLNENNSQDDLAENRTLSSNNYFLSTGCLKKGFMEAEEIVKWLTSCLYEKAYNNIPNGVKNDVYFVVKNDANVERRKKGINSKFPDDCKGYTRSSSATSKKYFVNNPEGKLRFVYKRGEQYCYIKTVKRKQIFYPLETQPSSENINVLYRKYSTSKKDSTFKRRVSWLGENENHLALVEYSGIFPGLKQQSNCKDTDSFQTSVTSEMSDMLQDTTSSSITKHTYDMKHNGSWDDLAENRTLSCTCSNNYFLSTGCLKKGFMEAEEIVKRLTSCLYEKAYNNIPNGVKNYVYFVVKNDANVERRKKGFKSKFPDDCQGYSQSNSSTNKNYLLNNKEGNLRFVYKRGEQFCYSKTVKGKKIFYPLETQPSPENIIVLYRYYTTSKKDSTFKRHVSWLGENENHLALVEYSGIFPGLKQQSNCKDTDSIQTSVTSEMSDMLQDTTSSSITKHIYDMKHNGSWDGSAELRTLTPNIHSLSNGCLNQGFLDSDEVIKTLTSFVYEKAHASIPDGIKNDVYFVVKNDENVKRRKKDAIYNFPDDCGVYNKMKGSSVKSYHVTNPEGTLKTVYKKGDQFCYTKQVKKKSMYYPLDTQPLSDNIIELFRHYSILKKTTSYRRRVSWLGGHKNHLALVEYFGTFPGLMPHGNCKKNKEYVRTPVMSEMSDLLHQDKPLDNKLTLKHNELSGTISKRQIHDKNHRDMKRQFKLKTQKAKQVEQSSIDNQDSSDEVPSAVSKTLDNNFPKFTCATSKKTPLRFDEQTVQAPSISEAILIEIEKEKLEIERKKLALEKEKIAIKREKLQMEKEKMKMKKRKLELFEEYVTLKKIKLTNTVSEACEVSCNY